MDATIKLGTIHIDFNTKQNGNFSERGRCEWMESVNDFHLQQSTDGEEKVFSTTNMNNNVIHVDNHYAHLGAIKMEWTPQPGPIEPGGGKRASQAGPRGPEGGEWTPQSGPKNPEGGEWTAQPGPWEPEGGEWTPQSGRREPAFGEWTPQPGPRNPEGGQNSPGGGLQVGNPPVRSTAVDGKRRFPCDLCGKVLKSATTLFDHHNSHKGIFQHQCLLCRKGFGKKAHLLVHMKTHPNWTKDDIHFEKWETIKEKAGIQTEWKCDICGTMYKSEWYYRRHVERHLQVEHDVEKRKNTTVEKEKQHTRNETIVTEGKTLEQSEPLGDQEVGGKCRFPCDICGKVLKSARSLFDHHNAHKGIYRNQCLLCGQGFGDKMCLLAHMKFHRNWTKEDILVQTQNQLKGKTSKLTCDIKRLEQRARNETKITEGENREQSVPQGDQEVDGKGRLFSCETCGKSFQYEENYKAHQLTHRTQQCEQCGVTTSNLPEHKRDIHGPRQRIACDICGKLILKKWFIKHARLHDKNHIRKRAMKICTLCGRNFTQAIYLEYHMWYHQNGKIRDDGTPVKPEDQPNDAADGPDHPFPCSLCDKEYAAPPSLIWHVWDTHKTHMAIICSNCDHVDAYLKPDQSESSSYKCTSCCDIMTHSQIVDKHSDMIRYFFERTCEVCKRGFSNKKELRDHQMRAHSDKRLFICPDCPKSFKIKRKLKQHWDGIHSGIKYNCPECPKTFNRKEGLNGHMSRIHLDNPYTCNRCGKGFNQWHQLRSHVSGHNAEDQLVCKCDQCGIRYANKTLLEEHLKSHM